MFNLGLIIFLLCVDSYLLPSLEVRSTTDTAHGEPYGSNHGT